LTISKHGRGFDLGGVVRVELGPGTAGFRVRHADHSASLPPQTKRKGLLAGKRKQKRTVIYFFDFIYLSLQGTVIIIANHGDRIDIPSGAVLENKIVSGNLRILQH